MSTLIKVCRVIGIIAISLSLIGCLSACAWLSAAIDAAILIALIGD